MRIKSVALIILFLLSISGCALRPADLGGTELSNRLLIDAVGLDRDAANEVTLTLQTLRLSRSGGEDGPHGAATLTFTAASVAEAVARAADRTGLTPFFACARVLVLGKAAADGGVLTLLDYFIRNRSVRNMVPVCVSKTTAKTLLNAQTNGDESAGAVIERALTAEEGGGTGGGTPFFRFVSLLRSADTCARCPIVGTETTDGVTHFFTAGDAVFEEDRARFTLEEDSARILRLLNGELKETALTCRSPYFTLHLRRIRRKIRFGKDGAVDLWITAEAAAPREPLGELYPADKAAEEALRKLAEEFLYDRARSCIDAVYGRYGADPLRLRKRGRLPDTVPPQTLRIEITASLKTTAY